ncbi:MAG: YiiD C-terminal domain-containing protein [Nevskia sp.]
MTPQALTDYLHRHIPLTAAMALRVVAFDEQRMAIAAPLAPNVNHRGSAFGGSLATLAIVSGWALLDRALSRAGVDAHLMVRNSDCDFREAVRGEFTAVSCLPETAWPRFLATLRKHRRAAIEIETLISADGRALVTQRGRYAAVLETPSATPESERP